MPGLSLLGINFQSSVGGKIIGIRFYKGPQNLGTHTAHLWSVAGALLGTATFSGNPPSQPILHSVSIPANTVYVASYFCPQGFYAADQNYFTNAHAAGVDRAGQRRWQRSLHLLGHQQIPQRDLQPSTWVDVIFVY